MTSTTQNPEAAKESYGAAKWCAVGVAVLAWLAAGVHIALTLAEFPDALTSGTTWGTVLLALSVIIFFGMLALFFLALGLPPLAGVFGVIGMMLLGLIGLSAFGEITTAPLDW